MIIWVFLIYGYICMYTLRSFIWKQDTCCIKMRREHQHNSSCYPSENCQIYFVKYGHQNELGVSWALPEPKNSISSWDQGPGQGLRLISPSPSKFWLEQVKHEYWNTFRVLPWKILYQGRDALGCVLCTFPFLLLVSGNAPPFALPGETPTPAPAGQGNHGAASLQSITAASKIQVGILDPSSLDLGQEEAGRGSEGGSPQLHSGRGSGCQHQLPQPFPTFPWILLSL